MNRKAYTKLKTLSVSVVIKEVESEYQSLKVRFMFICVLKYQPFKQNWKRGGMQLHLFYWFSGIQNPDKVSLISFSSKRTVS